MQRVLLLLALAVVLSFTTVFAQSLIVEPYGVSPAAIKADTVGDPNYLGIKTSRSTALNNVGVESKVYLQATFADSSITSLTWNLYAVPNGSNAALSAPVTVNDASEIVTFNPDLEGTYRISVTEGTYGDTVVINAAKYLGVENCKLCHNGAATQHYAPWSETGHATFLDRGLDGELGAYYGES